MLASVTLLHAQLRRSRAVWPTPVLGYGSAAALSRKACVLGSATSRRLHVALWLILSNLCCKWQLKISIVLLALPAESVKQTTSESS